MRGMKSDDLMAIVDFLYCGEANVYRENLDSFLVIAEELQLKGLVGKSDKGEEVEDESFKKEPPKKVKPVHKKEPSAWKPPQSSFGASDTIGGEVALTSHFSPQDFQELEDKCNSMVEKTAEKNAHKQPLYLCKVCGKKDNLGHIKSHIQANHLEGFSIPCNFCERTFRSRMSLATHTRSNHKNCNDNRY